MKKKHTAGIMIIFLLGCMLAFSSAAWSAENGIVDVAPIAAFKGSWSEIGRQIGLTYTEQIIDFGKIMGLVLQFAGPHNGWTPQAYYNEIEPLLPQSVKDHLQGLATGLAEARPLSYDTAWYLVLAQNYTPDLINMKNNMSEIPEPSTVEIRGCTAFAVTSEAGTFLCHNADATSTGGDDISVIMYWEPDNGDYAYLTMDPPGWADAAYALNEKGIGVSMNAGNPNLDAKIGLPVNCMIRYVMEHAATLDEAVGYFEDHLAGGQYFSTGGALVHFVDFNDSTMAKLQIRSEVLEVTYGEDLPSGATVIGAANHFVGDFNPDPDYYYESSFERYKRLLELLDQVETFDLDACWDVLSDTNGGEAGNTTISRAGDSVITAFGTIFTADGVYYTMGPPHAYLAEYEQPEYISYAEISTLPLLSFTATPGSRDITLNWKTEKVDDISGFNLFRSATQTGKLEKINDDLIKAEDFSTDDLVYEYTDTGLKNRNRYFYRLEVVKRDGSSSMRCIVNATPRMRHAGP